MSIIGPRLALYHNDQTLLSGNTSHLEVYAREGDKYKIVNDVPIFDERGYNIHGILSFKSKYFIVYGEKGIAILNDHYKVLKIKYFCDWILNGYVTKEHLVIFHFATNSIQTFNLEMTNECVDISIKNNQYLNFSTLALSSIFCEDEDSKVVLYVGTCFGPILKFYPLHSSDLEMSLSGHHGMVFALSVVKNIIFSIGDDRSFRSWDTITGKELSCSYGHDFRPFSITYCKDLDVHITSGADENICFWKFDKDNNNPRLIKKLKNEGGNVVHLKVHYRNLYGETIEYQLPNNNKIRVFSKAVDENRFLLIDSKGNLSMYNKSTNSQKVLVTNKSFRSDTLYLSPSNKVSLCTKDQVYFVDIVNNVVSVQAFENTIISTIWGGDVFFVSFSSGIVIVCDFDKNKVCKIQMRAPVQLSSAAVVDNNVFIGLKNGCFFYVMNVNENEITSPTQTFIYAHGKEAILDIFVDKSNVYTVGKDSLVHKWSYDTSKCEQRLTLSKTYPSSMEWPCKISIFNNKLYLLGFHAKYFKVFNLESQSKVCEYDCGGGHRCWSFDFKQIESNDGGQSDKVLEFNFINKGTIKSVKLVCNFLNNVSTYLHRLQINFIHSINESYFITGSVDTQMVLSKRISNKNGYKNDVLQRMSKHSSTVYDMLMFYKNGQKHMISSGGKGEINLWSWNKNKPDILKHLKLYKFDEDLRVISIAICPNYSGDESTVRPILCVLSDGSIYSLTIKDSHFSVMDKFVEDVKWMFTKIVGIGCNKFASITTHGYLYIFEVSDCGVIFHTQTIHIESCGLSALAFSQDNCIIVGSESGRIHIVSDYVKVAEARYHTSTCTGICAKKCEKGEINIFSVSLDCRISHYSFNGKRKELIFQKGKVLSISDPACVTESYGKILISGAGIEQLDRKIFEI